MTEKPAQHVAQFKQRSLFNVVPPTEGIHYRRPSAVLVTSSVLLVVFEIGELVKWRKTPEVYDYVSKMDVRAGGKHLATVGHDTVALTYKNSNYISFIDTSGTLELQYDITTDRKYACVCKMGDGKFLATTTSSLDLISKEGCLLKSVDGIKLREHFYNFGNLKCLDMTSQGDVLIANWGLLVCLSSDLDDVLWCYRIDPDEVIERTLYLSCDSGYVYVCSEGKKIVRLYEDGEHICTYHCDVRKPFGLGVWGKRIVVSQFLSNNIRIFDI